METSDSMTTDDKICPHCGAEDTLRIDNMDKSSKCLFVICRCAACNHWAWLTYNITFADGYELHRENMIPIHGDKSSDREK